MDDRSSVLYGPFSFVWGLGAVVLTTTLQGLAEKNDRYVFAADFVIGGAYEYMCSVFTELVFGTVFWDYSDMPLNIGGRTMACNAVLTSAAMLRYSARAARPQPANNFEAFIDRQYGDEFIDQRWPNMIAARGGGG